MRQRARIDQHDFVTAFLKFDRSGNAINPRAYNDDSRHSETPHVVAALVSSADVFVCRATAPVAGTAGEAPIVFGKFTAAGGLEGLRGERNFTCTLAAVVQRVGALWVQEPSAKSARSSCRAGA